MDGWICPGCDRSNTQEWGACTECRHLRPAGQDWPTGPVLILLYPGNTQIDAAERYSAHARHLAKVSYLPVATSWGEERPGVAVALFAAHLEEAGRVGTLLVTYRRDLIV